MGTVGIVIQEGDGEDDKSKDQFPNLERLDHRFDLDSLRNNVKDGQEIHRIAHRYGKGNR